MTLSIGGFSRVVAFPTAPIATGRSDPCRKGVAPSQEPCLSTAHAYTRSPRSAGLVSLRRLAVTACRAEGRHRQSARLDASVGAPGPRDFAVCIGPRSSGAVYASIATRLTCRDDWPNVPRVAAGCGKTIIFFRKTKEQYFSRKGLTYPLTYSDNTK